MAPKFSQRAPNQLYQRRDDIINESYFDHQEISFRSGFLRAAHAAFPCAVSDRTCLKKEWDYVEEDKQHPQQRCAELVPKNGSDECRGYSHMRPGRSDNHRELGSDSVLE
jgi:hypothetical protein